MNPRSVSTLFAAACVAAASAAHALPLSDRASFELFAGGSIATPGTFREATSIEGADGPTSFDRLNFNDIYRSGYTGGAEFDYAMDSHLSAFARAAYSQFNGEDRVVGRFSSETAGDMPIDARFGDAHTGTVDVGARYSFSAGEKWHPFVGASFGATRVSETTAMVGEPGGAPTTRVELGRASTVFEQRAETGVQFSPMENFDLRLTAAASHVDSGRPSGDTNLGLLGLDEENRSIVRGHWNFPAELGAVWHF